MLGKDGPRPISDIDRKRVENSIEDMTSQGMRVLAVGYRPLVSVPRCKDMASLEQGQIEPNGRMTPGLVAFGWQRMVQSRPEEARLFEHTGSQHMLKIDGLDRWIL